MSLCHRTWKAGAPGLDSETWVCALDSTTDLVILVPSLRGGRVPVFCWAGGAKRLRPFAFFSFNTTEVGAPSNHESREARVHYQFVMEPSGRK